MDKTCEGICPGIIALIIYIQININAQRGFARSHNWFPFSHPHLYWPAFLFHLISFARPSSHFSCFLHTLMSHCALLRSLSRSATSIAAMLQEAVMRWRRLMLDFSTQITPQTPSSHCSHTAQKNKMQPIFKWYLNYSIAIVNPYEFSTT